MKKLLLLIVIFLIGCACHAKNVSFILINNQKAYQVEGKLIDSVDPDYKGLIYKIKFIKECPPCSGQSEYLENGFYQISIDDGGGSWFLPARFFHSSENVYATPYQEGLPKSIEAAK